MLPGINADIWGGTGTPLASVAVAGAPLLASFIVVKQGSRSSDILRYKSVSELGGQSVGGERRCHARLPNRKEFRSPRVLATCPEPFTKSTVMGAQKNSQSLASVCLHHSRFRCCADHDDHDDLTMTLSLSHYCVSWKSDLDRRSQQALSFLLSNGLAGHSADMDQRRVYDIDTGTLSTVPLSCNTWLWWQDMIY